jgi:hypothetical protein
LMDASCSCEPLGRHGNLVVQGELGMPVERHNSVRSFALVQRTQLSVIPAGTRPSLFGGD